MKEELKKPLVVVLLPSVNMGSYCLDLYRAGIPVFLMLKSAFTSLARFVDYYIER